MRRVSFAGGRTAGTYSAQFSTTGRHARQTGNDYPANTDLNDNLEGLSNVFYLSSINPTSVSGSYYLRLNKGGDYKAGDIISGTSGGTCEIRIYKNGSSTVYFDRLATSNGNPTVKEYSGDTLTYTWSTQMTGSYYYCTVPGPPASITATRSGLIVNVTYTASTDDGGDAENISYTIQKAIVTGGTNGGSDGTVGTWSAHSNSTPLNPGTMYRFRVYATNSAGNGIATYSTNVLISVYGERYTGSTWADITNYYRFDGTNWVPISNFKRFNGSTWENMTDKS